MNLHEKAQRYVRTFDGISLRERLAAKTVVMLRASSRPHPRRYHATFYRDHGGTEIDGDVWLCVMWQRGRHAAVSVFRYRFKSRPTKIWDDWSGIGASDDEGLVVYLDQLNNYDIFPNERGLLLPEKSTAGVGGVK